MGIAGDLVIIVVAALLCGLIAQRFKMPVMLGYIVAGVLIGPNTLGPSVVHVEDVEVLADIGVALLLFTVGLEFPVERLAPVKNIALLGTPLQIILTIALGFGIGKIVGLPTHSCIWLGCLISVSSTMVVLKILSDRGLTGTLSSQVMTAILIVQDLAVIPMMILLPASKDLTNGLAILGVAVVHSLLFVTLLFVLGSRFLPWLMVRVASFRSREIFMVTVLALGLGIGFATYKIGLSFAFGAFLAGIILSRSDFSHHALSEIIPLRDLFSLIFFVSVGMLIEPAFIASHWHVVAFFIVSIFVGKALIFGFTTRAFGYFNIMPLAVGLYMFQVGEFAFVLARTGYSTGGISKELYLALITAAAFTMAVTPFIASWADPIYQWYRKRFQPKLVQTVTIVDNGLDNHIVIIGYGRIGSFIGSCFPEFANSCLIMEQVPERIAKAKKAGFHVIGGDASSNTLLEAARLERARLVINTIADPITSMVTQRRLHAGWPKLKVVARASSREHMEQLKGQGVYAALVPEYEASLSLIREASTCLGLPEQKAADIIKKVRQDDYTSLEHSFGKAIKQASLKKKTQIMGEV